ncbi:MAG: hypothetical protein ABS44_01760 [Chryseobacterium sp. SCN 40-13]|mgnify:CR=1 FL=1|nr:MAG: hypothetical protein ABS44_01760 [Chryseobacterium sp. SCN 40-13]
MRKKSLLLLLFLFSASFAFSQTAEPETSLCPNPKKLRGLCTMVGSRMKDREKVDHLYRTRFIEASCLDGSESEADQNKKIRDTWMAMENEFVCDSNQFDVIKGNILKYAVSTKFDDFIEDAIRWKVNLNRIDPSDNRTVLDYISFNIERHKGNALEGMFKHYYKLLREAGAKHKSEL